jgi:hypothetical protein
VLSDTAAMHTRALDDASLLALWERALPLPPAARERELARCFAPGAAPATLGAQRALLLEALALELRGSGGRLGLTSRCAQCGEVLEFAVDPAAIATTASAAPSEGELVGEGWRLHYRAPGPDDFVDAARSDDADRFAAQLLQRCVPEAECGGTAVAPQALPASALERLDARLQAADPLARIGFDLVCPTCEHAWTAPFDAALALWSRVQIAAEQLLADVDALARRYGWREADVLALTPLRRRAYLQLAG